jgi:Senescence-associated protein
MTSAQQQQRTSLPASPSPPPSPAPPHGEYEIILTAVASIVEVAPGTATATGTLQCIQGAVSENSEDGYFAFLTIDALQVPLVASHTSSCVGQNMFEIAIPGRTFVVTLDPQTEPSVVAGMEQLLRWFTTWKGAASPVGAHEGGAHAMPSASLDGETAMAAATYAPAGMTPGQAGDGPLSRRTSKIDRAGVKGADLVTKYGEKLNASIKARADASVAANADKPTKELKLGGAATAGVLGGAKKIVGAGAGVAAMAIDKISSALGSGLANNKVMVSMRDAPPGSQKRKVHDTLVSGAMALGRVYIAADNQGKLIFETTGDGAGRVAGVKYGAEAEAAARAAGHIGLDAYRIFRFPQKLVASSLVQGAVKGATAAHAQSGLSAQTEMRQGDAYAASASTGNPYVSPGGKSYSSSAM